MKILEWFRRRKPAPPIVDTSRRLRQLEVIAARLIRQGFSGQYHAAFHGRGIEFHQLRQYYPGDDIRTIDWNVTARSGEPYVREFIEERDLTILICLDTSGSMRFGSVDRRKLDVAVELSAVFALAAQQNNDRVGLIAFGGDTPVLLTPRRTRAHVDLLIRTALGSAGAPSGVANFFELARQIDAMTRRRAIIVVLSDFMDDVSPLRRIAWRHELIGLRLTDPREESMPSSGVVRLADLETGRAVDVALDHNEVRTLFWRRTKDLESAFTKMGADLQDISTTHPYERDLVRFFAKRAAPRRRVAS